MVKPNILYIITDQQSADMIGAKGKPGLRTPFLDSLMRRGISFENTFCTNPVCVPSRVSLLSGRLGGEIGCRNNTARGSRAAAGGDYASLLRSGIARTLRRAGYECVYGGKEHFPHYTAEELGFEVLTGDSRSELSEKGAEYLLGRKGDDTPFFFTASFINPHDVCYSFRYILEQLGTPDAMKIAPVARPYVEASFAALERIGLDEGSSLTPPLPENFEIQTDEPPCVSEQKANVRDTFTADHWRMLRYSYNRLTEQVDVEIGRLFAALKESGHEENTLVIFTSDHGEMAGSHQKVTKGMFYDECCRVPLLIAGPGVRRGAVDTEQLVSNGLDIVPTILDYAGMPADAVLSGFSLKPVLEDERAVFPRASAPIEGMLGFAVQTRDYLYALYDGGANREQLYDMNENRGQLRNDAVDPARINDLNRLRSECIKTFDRFLDTNDDYRSFQKPDWWN